jgi:hypothetical protein
LIFFIISVLSSSPRTAWTLSLFSKNKATYRGTILEWFFTWEKCVKDCQPLAASFWRGTSQRSDPEHIVFNCSLQYTSMKSILYVVFLNYKYCYLARVVRGTDTPELDLNIYNQDFFSEDGKKCQQKFAQNTSCMFTKKCKRMCMLWQLLYGDKHGERVRGI